jgi:hypothetical protein
LTQHISDKHQDRPEDLYCLFQILACS